MDAGTYDLAAVRNAEVDYWSASAVRFGDWEFRPNACEVWDYKLETCVLLSELEAYVLMLLIKAWPEYRKQSKDISKMTVSRIRHRCGRALILSDRRGYRFSP